MRKDGQKIRLESVAAEFALLAQRRARMVRQMALLETQHNAAQQSLAVIERRMAVLSQQMIAVEPALAPPVVAPSMVAPPVAEPMAAASAKASTATRPYARKYEHAGRTRPGVVLEY
jgi:hypothetical protein